MSVVGKLAEVRERMKICHSQLLALEMEAGIASKAGKLRDAPPNFFSVYDVGERHSDEHNAAIESEQKYHQERTTKRLRDLYFSVDDLRLKKALMAKDREQGDLALEYWQQDLADTAARYSAAQASRGSWWITASLCGIVSIALGYQTYGLPGAGGGLLIGYFLGRSIERRADSARVAAIAETDRELKEAQETWDKVRNEPQTFSRREAETGEPDKMGAAERRVQ